MSLVADTKQLMPSTSSTLSKEDSAQLQQQVDNLKSVWDNTVQKRVIPSKTTQFLAYEQLTMRQEAKEQIFLAIVAPAGFGKSHLLTVFMKHEPLHGRQ